MSAAWFPIYYGRFPLPSQGLGKQVPAGCLQQYRVAFNPFAVWAQRRLMPGTLPLRETVVSPLLSSDLEGFRRDKAALIARPHGRGHGQLFPSAQVRVSLLLSTEAILSCMLYLYHA